MVIGAGFLAKRAVRWTARQVGFSEGTANFLGNATKWGVALATLDLGGLVLDQIVDGTADSIADSLTDSLTDDPQPSRELASADDSNISDENTMSASDMEAYEEAYVQECSALVDGDTRGYDSEGDGDEDEDDVEDAGQVLEEIQPYLEMAVAAYERTSMSEEFEMIEKSQLISNVINPSHLFGCVGKTDTEVHVCISDDESVVFAFRGTEPTEWRNGFADVLTDLAQGQETVKLYDGSSTPAYKSQSLIRAHRGFQLALKDVTATNIPSQNLRLVLQGLGMEAEDVSSVVCVGHSLGGALATLCAKWCREVAFPGAKIGCVTMGAPRVGSVAFAADFNSRVVDGWSYRVVNKRDVVPCIPNLMTYPAFGSAYKHVSQPLYLHADGAGELSSRLGGRRPTILNLGFLDHPGLSYLNSVQELI